MKNLQANQFIPPETLEAFLVRNSGAGRPHKKLYFEAQPGPADKKELLNSYLAEVKYREEDKLKQRDMEQQAQKQELRRITNDVRQQVEKDVVNR